jgi:uncharacterized protein YjgD (DUF1641 family)
MAKAIRHIDKPVPTQVEDQAQAVRDVMKSVTESKDAVTTFLNVLKEAHEAGLLDMLHGLLKARQEVGYLAIKQINQPSMHRMIKNAMGAASFLGQVDNDQLQRLMNGMAHGMTRLGESPAGEKPAGIWGMTKLLRDPDVMAAMHTMAEFARGMGEHLHQSNSPAHDRVRG